MHATSNPFVRADLPKRFAEPLAFSPTGKPVYLIAGGDGSTEIPPAAPAPRMYTQEELNQLLGQVRAEEKDKLYPRIDAATEAQKQATAAAQAQQAQIDQLLADLNARKQAEEDARKQAEDLARQQAEAELSTRELLSQKEQEWAQRLEQTSTDWEAKLQQMAVEREQERAILEKERSMAQLSSYIQAKLAEAGDDIAPQLRDFVNGNSVEEIDAAIEMVKAKSNEIADAAREAFNASRAQMRGVSPTGYAPIGPMDLVAGEKQLSPQDIANMPMSEWSKVRGQLIGDRAANRGLYS